ncbi:unnamed protein product [Urochloa humidicola]
MDASAAELASAAGASSSAAGPPALLPSRRGSCAREEEGRRGGEEEATRRRWRRAGAATAAASREGKREQGHRRADPHPRHGAPAPGRHGAREDRRRPNLAPQIPFLCSRPELLLVAAGEEVVEDAREGRRQPDLSRRARRRREGGRASARPTAGCALPGSASVRAAAGRSTPCSASARAAAVAGHGEDQSPSPDRGRELHSELAAPPARSCSSASARGRPELLLPSSASGSWLNGIYGGRRGGGANRSFRERCRRRKRGREVGPLEERGGVKKSCSWVPHMW